MNPAADVTARSGGSRLARLARSVRESDLLFDLVRTPTAVFAVVVVAAFALCTIAPDWIAPYRVFDLTQISLSNAFIPPVWVEGGDARFLLGTDDQGRDMLSAIVYGARTSLLISLSGVALALLIGVALGLVAGFAGGWIDSVLMRIADIQLTFPAILIAVLMDGAARAAFGQAAHEDIAVFVLILAIGLSGWVQYARAVRGATLVERERDYVHAARLIGLPSIAVLGRHILPNVLTAVLVIATIHVAVAIILEATLSFIGLGVPPTVPSLGTIIRIGNDFLLSGEWWIAILPGLALVLIVLAANLLGDFLRDALDPRLK